MLRLSRDKSISGFAYPAQDQGARRLGLVAGPTSARPQSGLRRLRDQITTIVEGTLSSMVSIWSTVRRPRSRSGFSDGTRRHHDRGSEASLSGSIGDDQKTNTISTQAKASTLVATIQTR